MTGEQNSNPGMPLAALYAATTFLGAISEAEPLILRFCTMDELVQWARYNNLPYGTPQPFTAYFSVRHADGSPLSEAEDAILREAGSQTAYMQRQQVVLGGFLSDYAQTPELGAAHVAIHRFLKRGEGAKIRDVLLTKRKPPDWERSV